MSGSFEKSKQLAPPKAKYVEHILVATHAGEAGVAEIFRALQNRLRDSTWTIVFKSLIIVHLMIREGEPNVTLKYVAESPSKLAISNFSDVQVQGTNIRHYYTYLLARAKAYKDTRIDWVREGPTRLKRQTIDKGLLRETEAVQSQISKLLQCDLLNTEAENEITVCAFRLLTMDLLILYGIMNEGTINVLEHYFEMSKYDAERALAIYKTFTKQTNLVVDFLSTARQYENATRLEIPKLKHAPTSLTSSLEEYLKDPDFEINRRQYLAQQDAKKGKKSTSNGASERVDGFSKLSLNRGVASKAFPEPKPTSQPAPGNPEAKGPAPDLIDFFDSIEQNQQPMASAPQQQMPNFQTGPQHQQPQVAPQQTGISTSQQNFFAQNGQQPQPQNGGNFGSANPFGQPQAQQPVQQNFNGAGFGAYSQHPFTQQQDLFSGAPPNNNSQFSHPQQQFNTGETSFGPPQRSFTTPQSFASQQTGSSNPFRQSMMPQATGVSNPSYQNTPPVASPLQHQSTNPFARNISELSTGQMQNSPFPFQPPAQGSPFASPPPQLQQNTPFTLQLALQAQQQASPSNPVTPHRTGTNPFARTTSPPAASPLVPSQTGTNPFRQSIFANQQTGQGWQAGQGTMGGFEQLSTVPIFPRPGQPQQQQGTWP
ncbi:MAG: hypothetical protein ASARMPRED_000313 [Alectoria sarmentosa]|nr:MAG: hypothetical protein ASARMPRED_000313 [Alectoria sarmentosa]